LLSGRWFVTFLYVNNPLQRATVPDKLHAQGGLTKGASAFVSKESGTPEADVYGVGSFFHLLAEPDIKVRVCQGLACKMAGADDVLAEAEKAGFPVKACSCLAACDQAPAVLKDRRVLYKLGTEDIKRCEGEWSSLSDSLGSAHGIIQGCVGPDGSCPDKRCIDFHGSVDLSGRAFKKAQELGAEEVISAIDASGLQGRGGAGFPAAFKWKSVRDQSDSKRYVVLNADEGEPGTFKDREILLRRPDKVLEGLAIAARAVAATEVFCYLRGEFEAPWQVLQKAIDEIEANSTFEGIHFHMHAGQGAYICGEETALLEALEGKRGLPRLKPPFPTEKGLWGKPTLIHNVETIACVPSIIERGGAWFKELGRTGAGTKLYCISGHVQNPGTYELPLGVTLDELVEEAGGYVGTLKSFSPGGASAGFLPAEERTRPLDFKSLSEAGSMLGSAGVTVLNDTVNMAWAAQAQLVFYESESCGQCAPCRIGTRFLRESLGNHLNQSKNQKPTTMNHLNHIADAAWEMNEGSICGLGQIAALPLTSALKYFPEDFKH